MGRTPDSTVTCVCSVGFIGSFFVNLLLDSVITMNHVWRYYTCLCLNPPLAGIIGGGDKGAMPPLSLFWDTACKKRSRYSNRTVMQDLNTLIEQSQYSEKQCSKLLSYVCVVINKKI